MESLLLSSQMAGDVLPPHCHPQNAFLAFVSAQLQTCIPTPVTFLSSIAGLLSITAWLFAQFPQIIKNYRQQSSESLSFMFILIWCLGDSSNLLGAVLLNQMTFQKVVAAYYVLVDVVLVAQWRWYNRPSMRAADEIDDNRRASASGRDKELRIAAANASPDPGRAKPKPANVFMTLALLLHIVRAAPINAAAAPSDDLDKGRLLGMILGWSSTVLYLSSRLPQIYLNHKRRSVSGLSPLLFAAAFCGNFCYSASLLLNPSAWRDLPAFGEGGWVGEDGTTTTAWWTDTLPFLLGSAGVLAQDGYIGLQFWKWGGKIEEDDEDSPVQVIVGVDTRDDTDRDRGHGKTVNVNVDVKERSYFDEQTALLARMNGVVIYGSSAESSRSAELRR
ncbi:hypothetical protein TWF696_003388 [Orbilia brochopaga]|uniref:Uncharacterized protein n=1 Tax=Orbilia brochopaga TaxID=3140254 RepID=A0AAV9TZZ7_9PEZI